MAVIIVVYIGKRCIYFDRNTFINDVLCTRNNTIFVVKNQNPLAVERRFPRLRREPPRLFGLRIPVGFPIPAPLTSIIYRAEVASFPSGEQCHGNGQGLSV